MVCGVVLTMGSATVGSDARKTASSAAHRTIIFSMLYDVLRIKKITDSRGCNVQMVSAQPSLPCSVMCYDLVQGEYRVSYPPRMPREPWYMYVPVYIYLSG